MVPFTYDITYESASSLAFYLQTLAKSRMTCWFGDIYELMGWCPTGATCGDPNRLNKIIGIISYKEVQEGRPHLSPLVYATRTKRRLCDSFTERDDQPNIAQAQILAFDYWQKATPIFGIRPTYSYKHDSVPCFRSLKYNLDGEIILSDIDTEKLRSGRNLHRDLSCGVLSIEVWFRLGKAFPQLEILRAF